MSPETSSSTHRKNSVVDESLSTPEGLPTSVVALLKSPFSLETTGRQSDAWKYREYEKKTLVKALRSFGSFRPETNFQAWIFQILRNTFSSSQSRLDRRKTVALDPDETLLELPGTMGTAESVLIERADAHLVLHAIDMLPPAFREVVLLCDVEEMSYREIAEVLSIPIGTVMSRLARARKAVRGALAVTTRVTRASQNGEVARAAATEVQR